MSHISSERVAALAGGEDARRGEARHLAACATCARRLSETVALLEVIRRSEDPMIPAERWEDNAARVAERIAVIKPGRARPRRWRWTTVPLAAALALSVLSGVRDSHHRAPPLADIRQERDLDAGEFDCLVRSMARSNADFGIMELVLSRGVSPWAEIAAMSPEELAGFLDEIGTNGNG